MELPVRFARGVRGRFAINQGILTHSSYLQRIYYKSFPETKICFTFKIVTKCTQLANKQYNHNHLHRCVFSPKLQIPTQPPIHLYNLSEWSLLFYSVITLFALFYLLLLGSCWLEHQRSLMAHSHLPTIKIYNNDQFNQKGPTNNIQYQPTIVSIEKPLYIHSHNTTHRRDPSIEYRPHRFRSAPP